MKRCDNEDISQFIDYLKSLDNPLYYLKIDKTYVNIAIETVEPFPLGYSASGVITEIGKAVSKFHVGDRVAICGSGFANHAEYNFVP